MKYNFDQVIDRNIFPNSKWEDIKAEYHGYDVQGAIPMWVADMEFCTLPEVSDALMQRSAHGIFGYYSNRGLDEFVQAVAHWVGSHYRWEVQREWVLYCPGIVTAINIAVQAYTKPQDSVAILSPVYFPFKSAIQLNERIAVEIPLSETDNNYTIDYGRFEKAIRNNNVRMLIHCSPHNPIGRVWKADELERICEICYKYNVRIFSDDIHADLVFKPNNYLAIPAVNRKYEEIVTVGYSCGKTFNLAGLETASIIIPNEKSRKEFMDVYSRLGLSSKPNSFGGIATVTAYLHGDTYVQELVEYLNSNIVYVCKFIQENMPKLKVKKPEGTYLVWIDYRGTGMSDETFEEFLFSQAKIVADAGHWFGENGSGFMRLNMAFPKATIEDAMCRLKLAYDDRFRS